MIDPLSAPDDVWFQKGSVARFQSWRGLWAERREKRSIGSSLSPRRSLHYQASPPRLLVTTTTLDVVRMLWRSVIINKHNYSPWSKLKKFVSGVPPQATSVCVWAAPGRSGGAWCEAETCTCRRTPGTSGRPSSWCRSKVQRWCPVASAPNIPSLFASGSRGTS